MANASLAGAERLGTAEGVRSGRVHQGLRGCNGAEKGCTVATILHDDNKCVGTCGGHGWRHWSATGQVACNGGLLADSGGMLRVLYLLQGVMPVLARRTGESTTRAAIQGGLCCGTTCGSRIISRGGSACPRTGYNKAGLWMPFHFWGAAVNELTIDPFDEATRTAEFKVAAARVEVVHP